jgi:biotin carboxylase
VRPPAGRPDQDRPALLLLGAAGSVPFLRDLTARAVAAARQRGMRIHLTDQAAALRAAPWLSGTVDDLSAVDYERPADCVAWARQRGAAGERFDVVLGLREYAQVAAAEVAAALGAPGNPPSSVRRVRTKDLCRAALAEAGFRQPAFRVCADVAAATAFLRASRGPWIVKPRDAMGSMGVTKVADPAELPAAVAAMTGSAPFLVEEYVTGHEYSVEGIFRDGHPQVLAVTDKEILPPPSFVEVGHALPATVPGRALTEITREVTAALTQLELCSGIFHVEIWLTEQGVVMGEVHVRTGGDWIHLLLAEAIPGLDMYGLVYDDALGRERSQGALTPSGAAAVRFLSPPPGRLIRVDGFGQVANHPAVVRAELSARPGMTIKTIKESFDRVGAVVVRAATAPQAQDLARRLAASVQFIMAPDGLPDDAPGTHAAPWPAEAPAVRPDR